jgi:hypothetical protein
MNRKFLNAVVEVSPDGTRGGLARLIELNPARLTELVKGRRGRRNQSFRSCQRCFRNTG